jgi:hypothetical protein
VKQNNNDGQQRAERLLELIASGDTCDEAQAEFDRLLTPELHEKLVKAFLKRRERSAKNQNERFAGKRKI